MKQIAMKYLGIFSTLLLLLGAGCVNEKPYYDNTPSPPESTDVGYLNLSTLQPRVMLDSEVNDAPIVGQQAAATRAVTEASDDYIVRIYNAAGEAVLDTSYGNLQTQFTDGSAQNLLALPVGSYRLYVCSHADEAIQDVAWESPVYCTEHEFSVLRTHTADAPLTLADEVVCTLSNIKVTVTISADLAAMLSDDTQSTVAINGTSIVFGKTETRAAHFRPQAEDDAGDTLEFLLTGQKEGKEVQLEKSIPGVKAGQWRKIALSIVYNETGDLDIAVTVNSFVVDDEINVNGTAALWEPILEEPSGLPELTWPGHELTEGMALNSAMYDAAGEFTGTAPVLTLTAPNGIRTLVAGITSNNATFSRDFIETGYVSDIDLCGSIPRLSPFRTLPVTAGATEATLDLQSLLWVFHPYAGEHTLTFAMTDDKGQQSAASLTFTYTDGGAAAGPTIVWLQGDIDQPQTVTDGLEIDIDVTVPAGIRNFVITINSEVLAPLLASMELGDPFDLCNVTSPTQAETLNMLGFPINDAIKGSTSKTIVITQFVSLLAGLPGTHAFELSVTDNNGLTTTKTLTLIVPGA